ncbi:YcxB family protein [Clostridium botulinum]|nr:YcxB family protein [Clostridium botulinum]MBN1056003.1 YcxB family protein [Clostridium botulinum]NFN94711.1 YcxB family protein [Clostridium botulinum]NFO86343.1 YcxB family protein [Clostridium botulinum]NFP29584.1 YcxB family protein [Clostridium botulinum]
MEVKMKLEFSIEEEDYINFNMHYLDNSKKLKQSMYIFRFILPIIISFLIVYIISKIVRYHIIVLVIAYFLIYFIWIYFFEKSVDESTRKRIKKVLSEGKNKGLLGKRTFEINDNYIKDSNKYRTQIVNINALEKIFITDEYVFFYISSISAFIVPLRIFESNEEKEEFKNYVNSIKKSLQCE